MDTSLQNKLYELNAPYVIHETIEGETIIMNLKNGFYYSFDGIGPVIWDLIVKGAHSLQIIHLLQEIFGDAAQNMEKYIIEFIDELRANEIILEKDPTGQDRPALTPEGLKAEKVYSEILVKKPLFRRYADMRDVLLLDPIHDVDEKGWPEPKIK